MGQTKLELFNLALSVVGADYTVANVDEQSIAAETCRMWYDNVRKVVLRTAHWNSAKRYSRLEENAERTSADWDTDDPEPGYIYSFEAPRDMVSARHLSTFAEFSLGYASNRNIISTNEVTPIITYTADTDPALWEPDLYQAIVYSLAAQITSPLTGKGDRVRANFAMAYELIQIARTNSANEYHRMFESRPEVYGLRGTNFSAPSSPYIYPYGSFFAGTGAATL